MSRGDKMKTNDIRIVNNELNKLNDEVIGYSQKIFNTTIWSGTAADNAKELCDTYILDKISSLKNKMYNLNKTLLLGDECEQLKQKINSETDESIKTELKKKYDTTLSEMKTLVK